VSDGNGGSDSATVSVEIFPVICTGERVTTTDGDVEGIFDRLSDDQSCKRYVLEADGPLGEVLFVPEGGNSVRYRGYLSFEPKPAPSGDLMIGLEYDPTGGTTFRAVQWCLNPQFDGTVRSPRPHCRPASRGASPAKPRPVRPADRSRRSGRYTARTTRGSGDR
jgi:hypothetical protein